MDVIALYEVGRLIAIYEATATWRLACEADAATLRARAVSRREEQQAQREAQYPAPETLAGWERQLLYERPPLDDRDLRIEIVVLPVRTASLLGVEVES